MHDWVQEGEKNTTYRKIPNVSLGIGYISSQRPYIRLGPHSGGPIFVGHLCQYLRIKTLKSIIMSIKYRYFRKIEPSLGQNQLYFALI